MEKPVSALLYWKTKMLHIFKYAPEHKQEWNSFLEKSINGTFLFHRDYMEYHADRFVDFSLLVYEDSKLVALLPANLENGVLASHNGLTFGGLIVSSDMRTVKIEEIMRAIIEFLKPHAIREILYKCIPYIYRSVPSDEDLYVLFKLGAELFRRDVTSAIYLPKPHPFKEARKRWIKKATATSLRVTETEDYKTFWIILEANLLKQHKTKPVHSLDEIQHLHTIFPNNIKLFASYQNNAMLAGVLIYESRHVAHAQYIANTDQGKATGGLDIIFAYLIDEYYQHKEYFDFGISTEKYGQFLNKGLIEYKEGFGARTVVHDFYKINLSC